MSDDPELKVDPGLSEQVEKVKQFLVVMIGLLSVNLKL